jgi:hypothetical protein
MTDFQKSLRVDVSDAGALSLLFTAVLVKTNQKHPLPVKSEDYALKYLPRVFTSTSNPHGKRTSAQIRKALRSGPYGGSCECVRD